MTEQVVGLGTNPDDCFRDPFTSKREFVSRAKKRMDVARRAAYANANLSPQERRLRWLKARHEIVKLRKQYPGVDFK